MHLNDTYRVGAVEDGRKGGFGRVVTIIEELQAGGSDVRILHGGDFLYPSLESQLWHGMQMVEAMNYLDDLAPMYVALGNHEFDPRSPEYLINAVRGSSFDWLGDNVDFVTGDIKVDAHLRKTFTFEHGDKLIGLFSLTLHPDSGGNERDYLRYKDDYVGVAREAIEALEARGADAIIGVTHLHMATDVEIAQLKAEHPKLAFIVGGHDHEPQYSEGSATAATVMKGASNARSIWTVELTFDDDGLPVIDEHIVELGVGIASNADYDKLDEKWRARLLEVFPFLTARVGSAAVAMDATEERIRSKENGWGNFVVDQMRGAFGKPAADLAFINSGTLRIDDIVADDITFEDIARTFGFSSFLRHMTISGGEFREVMEAGYRGYGSQGYFPQVSGFRICVDRRQPAGQRIVSLQVPTAEIEADTVRPAGWQEIESDAEYSLVVPDYLYGGGDGYELPQDRPASRPGSELKYLVLDGIVRAQAEGRAVGALPDPDNPRFVELGPDRASCWPN